MYHDEKAREALRRHVVRAAVEEQEKAGGEIQTVIFSKDKWTIADAKEWLKDHDLKAPKVDETEDSLRFRQKEPGQFKRYATKKVPNTPGVSFVFGWRE